MNVMVLGAGGFQGRASAFDLASNEMVKKLVLVDVDRAVLQEVSAWIGSSKLVLDTVDCRNKEEVTAMLKKEEISLLVLSVPWLLTLPPVEAAIESGVDVVDFGLYQNIEFDERIEEYDRKAKEAGVAVVPSCGLAPGITNITAANGAREMDRVDTIQVYVGGNPEKPEPPLYYKTVWSIQGVWNQFMEPCRVIKDGKPDTLEATTEVEDIEFKGLGRFEIAYTDGLGSLLQTYKLPILKGARNIYEKTVRWPGHYHIINVFKGCGLLDNKPLSLKGADISPREFLTALLDPVLRLKEDERDMVTMRVNVIGEKDGEKKIQSYEMVDYKDTETGITSMSRTTGFTGAVVAGMFGQGKIKEKGVVFPEIIGADEELYTELVAELKKRNIVVRKL